MGLECFPPIYFLMSHPIVSAFVLKQGKVSLSTFSSFSTIKHFTALISTVTCRSECHVHPSHGLTLANGDKTWAEFPTLGVAVFVPPSYLALKQNCLA
jgi:hypothetical protein